MRLPPQNWRGSKSGGCVLNSLGKSRAAENAARPSTPATPAQLPRVTNDIGRDPQVAALSIEFVAKPQEAPKVHSAIPAAIAGALREVTGFAGCFVFVSNLEARLVTVVTLWTGEGRVRLCNENARWVRAALKPYLDHCLRVQTLAAFIPVPPEVYPALGRVASLPRHESLRAEDELLQLV